MYSDPSFVRDCDYQKVTNEWLELVNQNMSLIRNMYPSTRFRKRKVLSQKCLNRRCVIECNVLKPKRSDGSKFSNIVDSKSEDGVMSDTPTNETTSSASIEALKCQSGLINFTDKLGKPHRRVFVPGVGWTSAKRAVVFKSEANVMS